MGDLVVFFVDIARHHVLGDVVVVGYCVGVAVVQVYFAYVSAF